MKRYQSTSKNAEQLEFSDGPLRDKSKRTRKKSFDKDEQQTFSRPAENGEKSHSLSRHVPEEKIPQIMYRGNPLSSCEVLILEIKPEKLASMTLHKMRRELIFSAKKKKKRISRR